MRLYLTLCLLALGVVFSSCSVTKSTNREIIVAKSGVLPKKMIAEMNVDINKKITGQGRVSNGNSDDAKDLAKWNAIKDSGADAIIDPVFKVTQTAGTVVAEVSGYYGEFVSIETATSDDIMTYIQVNLAGGTGILGISFSQFKAYYDYYFDKYDVEDQFRLSDDQLYYDYSQKISAAQQAQSQQRKKDRSGGQPGKGLKIITTVLLVGLVTSVIPLLTN